MTRVDVIAYSPTEFVEDVDTSIGYGHETVEGFPLTWVDTIDSDRRTLEELETLFG